MVTVTEVKTKRDIKEFIELPLRLYKGRSEFVPPLYADEKKLILAGGKPKIADSVFFLAKRDGRTVGRISGIIQKQYNELHNESRVRFTRFDSVDDAEVAKALFSAVEEWGKARGMDTLCGPLGYSDLDREGLLIDGFDELSTFEEQYNYDYYPALVEAAGLTKEVDWLEFELTKPEKPNPMLSRVASRALELSKLHMADISMPKKAYINKYKDGVFTVIDECYSKLYGTVPISEGEKAELISQFMLILNNKYLPIILDENDRVVAFGLCFPSIGRAVQKSGGRLTPAALIKLLSAVRSPSTLDLGLVAILPEYQNAGINAVLLDSMVRILSDGSVKTLETNLNLETNTAVLAQWKHFTARQHKRRRAYVKKI